MFPTYLYQPVDCDVLVAVLWLSISNESYQNIQGSINAREKFSRELPLLHTTETVSSTVAKSCVGILSLRLPGTPGVRYLEAVSVPVLPLSQVTWAVNIDRGTMRVQDSFFEAHQWWWSHRNAHWKLRWEPCQLTIVMYQAMGLCNIFSNMDRLKFCAWQGLRQATDVTVAEREGKMFGCSFRKREKDGSLLCGQ